VIILKLTVCVRDGHCDCLPYTNVNHAKNYMIKFSNINLYVLSKRLNAFHTELASLDLVVTSR